MAARRPLAADTDAATLCFQGKAIGAVGGLSTLARGFNPRTANPMPERCAQIK